MGASPAVDSAFAVIREGRKILLVRTRTGRWQLPGGHLERGEKHWTAARREALEETGLRIDLLDLTGIYARKDGSRAVVFTARAPGAVAAARPRNEIVEHCWVRWSRARKLLPKKRRRRVRDALAAGKSRVRSRGRRARWRAVLRRSG